MATVLDIIKTEEGDTTIYSLSGNIDDNSDFSVIEPTSPNLVLDFQNVSSVNSYGIKKWAVLLTSLESKNVSYRNIPTILVEQINIINHLRRGVTLESFYLPFGCESCDIEIDKLVTLEDVKTEGYFDSLDELYDCERCRSHLEFLDDEDIYFIFLDE